MKRIIFFRSGDQYTAMLAGKPAMWAVGRTADEAIGCLISAHSSEFDIELQEAERG